MAEVIAACDLATRPEALAHCLCARKVDEVNVWIGIRLSRDGRWECRHKQGRLYPQSANKCNTLQREGILGQSCSALKAIVVKSLAAIMSHPRTAGGEMPHRQSKEGRQSKESHRDRMPAVTCKSPGHLPRLNSWHQPNRKTKCKPERSAERTHGVGQLQKPFLVALFSNPPIPTPPSLKYQAEVEDCCFPFMPPFKGSLSMK